MPLTPRDRYTLGVKLAQKYHDQVAGTAKRVASAAGVDMLDLALDNLPPLDVWKRVVRQVEDEDKLSDLLDVVYREHGTETYFPTLKDELQNGRALRLDMLARAIRDGECVLFMGAGMLLCDVQISPNSPYEKMTFSRAFSLSLAKSMRDKYIYFDEKQAANLAYTAQRYGELTQNIPGMLGKMAQDFYVKCRPDTRLYEQLAKLPFRVVLNTNPDAELATILNEKSPESCTFRYYNVSNNIVEKEASTTPTDPSTTDFTLLYNLFGYFNDRPSMVLTESQLLDFTNRILNKNPALDPRVMDEFTAGENAPKYYLFLGFDFDQWYVKIVFQTVLKLVKQKDRSVSIFPKGIDYNQFVREFFEEEFKCYFIDDDLPRFLDDLIVAYRKLAQ